MKDDCTIPARDQERDEPQLSVTVADEDRFPGDQNEPDRAEVVPVVDQRPARRRGMTGILGSDSGCSRERSVFHAQACCQRLPSQESSGRSDTGVSTA